MRAFADRDNDGRVDVGEWLAFHDQLLSSPIGFDVLYKRSADFLFGLLDRDGDGMVDLADHRAFLGAFGIEVGAWADDNFAAADTNGDGRLDKTEVEDVIRDFYRSDDAAAIASSWFGPIA